MPNTTYLMLTNGPAPMVCPARPGRVSDSPGDVRMAVITWHDPGATEENLREIPQIPHCLGTISAAAKVAYVRTANKAYGLYLIILI